MLGERQHFVAAGQGNRHCPHMNTRLLGRFATRAIPALWSGLILAMTVPDVAGAQIGASTNHRVAACRSGPDMPICILRVLAQEESSLFPYRTRPEFAGSPAVIAAIGEIDGAAEQRATQEGGLVNSLIVAPELTRQRAVEAVLAADRLGAPPSEALAPIASLGLGVQSQGFFGGQIVTPSGAELRIRAYEEIWSRRQSPVAQRPSQPLIVAALEAWERVIAVSRSETVRQGAGDLAMAYSSIGDLPGVDRAAALSASPTAFRIRGRLEARQFEAALEIAESSGPATGAATGDDASATELLFARATLAQAAIDGGRPDVALRLAEADRAVGEGMSRSCDDVCLATPALRVLLDHATPESQRAWAERLSNAGRGRMTSKELYANRAAVMIWSRLGERGRANEIISRWRPLADAQKGEGCGGDGVAFCIGYVVGEMLYEVGDLEQARAYGLDPSAALNRDMQDGRGITRLSEHLTDASAFDATMALSACVDRAALRRAFRPSRLADARTCLDRLYELPAPSRLRSGSPVVIDGRLIEVQNDIADLKAVTFARAAAENGDLSGARAALATAMENWLKRPDQPIENYLGYDLEAYAIAELRAAGRLAPLRQ
ncbi:MAG: hypothetical protein ACK5T5_12260 [Phenylobacterium sp.]